MTGIYKITCKANNKIYVGQSIDIETRWVAHKRELSTQRHHNIRLQNAWNKYGGQSFIFEVIEECKQENLNEKEIYWIKFYDSFKNGFNLTIGGEGTNGKIYSDEERQRRCGEGNPFYGKKHKEGWLERIQECSMEKTCKPIYQIDRKTKEIVNEFISVSEASRVMNCSITAISLVLNGKNNSALGYYWIYKSDYNENIVIPTNKNIRPILQLDPNTNEVIAEFKSIADANRKFANNRRNSKIIMCLTGEQRLAHGYKWVYKN